jgi:hypothetical protein
MVLTLFMTIIALQIVILGSKLEAWRSTRQNRGEGEGVKEKEVWVSVSDTTFIVWACREMYDCEKFLGSACSSFWYRWVKGSGTSWSTKQREKVKVRNILNFAFEGLYYDKFWS